MQELNACCLSEAQRSLRKHRHVANCDACGSLVLGYGSELDYDRTIEELTDKGLDFQVGRTRKLRVIAYQR